MTTVLLGVGIVAGGFLFGLALVLGLTALLDALVVAMTRPRRRK